MHAVHIYIVYLIYHCVLRIEFSKKTRYTTNAWLTMYSVQHIVYSVQYLVYIVHYTLYYMPSKWYISS